MTLTIEIVSVTAKGWIPDIKTKNRSDDDNKK